MIIAEKQVSIGKDDKIPPRERILAVAADLFYRHGIRAVGVESIAEAAGTNKMTLYRHFASKDELVAEYLRRLANKASSSWDRLAAAHPGNPRAQLRGWLHDMAAHVGSGDQRGCALANAAVELPEKDHPARRVIEAFKTAQRQRIIDLCAAAELASPEMLADELFLLLEGARVTAQSIGRDGLGDRLMRMGEAMIAAHDK
jgi:AcrR family transcriptional regulator